MTRKIVLLLFILLAYNSCMAQIKLRAIACYDYSFGFPTGDLHTYINGKLFNGLHFHWRYFFKRDFSLGLSAGWNDFQKELPRAVYETDKGTVSAVQTRYFGSTAVAATAYYYMRSLHYVMPYAGGSIGGYFLRYEKFFGVAPLHDKTLRFGIRPELGLIVPFKKSGLGLILNGRYNEVFYSHAEITNLRYFEATIGLYFGYPVFDDSF